MSSLFQDVNSAWAALLIVTLPLVIIGTGEFEERLRQRDSPFKDAVSTVRVWVVPLATVWVLGSILFEVSADNVFQQVLGSVIVLAGATAALSALGVVALRLTDQPRRTGRRPIPRLLIALPRLLFILATGWLLIAGVWGVDLSAALTALGVTSLVISFALQDTLSGIASGFTLLADQPFSPGDWIESDDVEGRVVDVNWRATRIEDRNGDLIVVPNGSLSKATITNYDRPSRLHRVMVPVQIERTAPPTDAKAMLLDAARSTPGVVEEPPPVVFVSQIADPVVDYETFMWVDDYSIVPRVKADFGALVWYLSYRHGVPLPNPAQDLYLFDGTRTAIESQLTNADIRRRLVGAPVLAEVSDDVLDQLASGASVEQYQVGETILAGNEDNDLCVFHSGRARLMLRRAGEEIVVADIEAGELVGTLDDSSDPDQTVFVVATTDCEVVRVRAEAAARAIALAPEIAVVLDQLAMTRRRRIDRVLRRVARDAIEIERADPTPRARAGEDDHS
jgi:small-conductance mechanosensitive channel/CRP-like cAMP-binding protein